MKQGNTIITADEGRRVSAQAPGIMSASKTTESPITISHIYYDNEWHIQTNEEHCDGVARLASEFASEFGMADWGHMIGLLHDRGKESGGFQAYIRKSSGYDPKAFSTAKKEHSYIGAILAHRHQHDRLYWLSNAIAGHHRGLYNIDELALKMTETIPEEVSQNVPDYKLPPPSLKLRLEDASHISRMLFSCLVDADWLDTEKFIDHDRAASRGKFSELDELDRKLQAYLRNLKALPPSHLNDLRNVIQAKCEDAASLEPGFFELTVPTGGGKTIASVIWAIKHAMTFNKKRVIIAIPFTSIIVQTAAMLREIFGDENVVEHHSVMNESSADERSLLACENWDAPIIVTTNVQLFESMFSNRRAACRKLHSIVNSVVILDEVQTLPLKFLQPIVDGMTTYAKLFGTSFLFCTASQPVLDGERMGGGEKPFKGIGRDKIRSIISDDMRLHDQLRRAKIEIDDAPYSYKSLAESLKKHKRVLCIVSSRKHALELYNELSKDTNIATIHLSRSMCSAHILEKIAEIKNILGDQEKGIRVVSTQLIEAGVDIDFPVVYRQLAGLDSILQAAGRCNREGRAKEGKTIVFSFKDCQQASFLRFASDTMKALIDTNRDADWFSPDMMRLYYEKLYCRTDSFDENGIEELLNDPRNCQFEEASNKFHLIDETGVNIIINFGDSEKLIRQLMGNGPSRKLSRQLGRFSVTVQKKIFDGFNKAGLIEEPYPGFYFIRLREQYDNNFGLKSENELEEQTFII